jgi:hypothetical protein
MSYPGIFERGGKSMICSFCEKKYSSKKGVSMSVDGQVIANYCSTECRSKAAKKIIQGLEESETLTLEIPIISKHHCCSACKNYQPRKGWCKFNKKLIEDCGLECKPKPEWEKTDVK